MVYIKWRLLSVVECAIQCPHILWTMHMAFRQGLGKIVMMKSILTPENARSQLRGVVLWRREQSGTWERIEM